MNGQKTRSEIQAEVDKFVKDVDLYNPKPFRFDFRGYDQYLIAHPEIPRNKVPEEIMNQFLLEP